MAGSSGQPIMASASVRGKILQIALFSLLHVSAGIMPAWTSLDGPSVHTVRSP